MNAIVPGVEDASTLEILADREGALVRGSRTDLERLLASVNIVATPQLVPAGQLARALGAGAALLDAARAAVDQSAHYLKLTPDSAERLRKAGGLMPTKSEGISHAMLGKTGEKSMSWLQVQGDGTPGGLAAPAVLPASASLMGQLAQQQEAKALRQLLVQIDGKLDDVRRAQRDSILGRLGASAGAVDEAQTLSEYGADPATTWSKLAGTSETILNVQEEALLELRALADKADAATKPGQIGTLADQSEQEVAVYLAVLARCFELQDRYRDVELYYVRTTAPQHLECHRAGIAKARADRRTIILESTGRLMSHLDAAGAVADAHALLHSGRARRVIGAFNSTGAIIEDFHRPLGIEPDRRPLQPTHWRQALRDRGQVITAAKEVGFVFGATVASAVGAVAVAALSSLVKKDDGDSER